jgi:hypothetical protein
MVIMGLYDDFIENMGHIDLCICDLGLDDLLTLRQMLDNLRPRLAQDAKIVVFHQNLSGSNLDSLTYDFTNNTFPLFGRSRVIFSGSLLGAVAARWFHSALYRYNVFRLRGALAFMAVLVGCAPLARLASWWETRRDPEKLPRHCISMVIEIDMAG